MFSLLFEYNVRLYLVFYLRFQPLNNNASITKKSFNFKII